MLLAHYNRETETEQSLDEHLLHVAEQMSANMSSIDLLALSQTELQELFAVCGRYHDAGKAMPAFQNYLQTGKGGSEKNHALISAALLSGKLDYSNPVSVLPIVAVARHHQALDTTVPDRYLYPQLRYLQQQDQQCRQALAKQPSAMIDLPQQEYQEARFIEFWGDRLDDIIWEKQDQYFFLLQFLFSRLVAADKLDSAGLAVNNKQYQPELKNLQDYLQANLQNGQATALNQQREEIRCKVTAKIKGLTDQEIKEQRLFTFTAPTGTGKTLSSLSAALTLAERIYETEGFRPKLITAIPFINIIEQTMKVYKNIFDDILVHCSLAAGNYQTKNSETPLQEQHLLTETWEHQVILTTFVQFFESILTGNNQKVMKLHQLRGAIVILDEVQALPARYYALLGAVISRLAQYYGARVIMMTATQPEIINYARRLIDDNKMKPMELLEDSSQYYQRLQRTMLVPVFDQFTDLEGLAAFIGRTRSSQQTALVVLNTISQSIEMYNLLQDHYQGTVEVLYLSTNITSVDREKVIAQARIWLAEDSKKPFIMVSTQTIEAGVDLDFDIGYRDLAPLESIIQVAGRVNRSAGKQPFSPVFIFDLRKAGSIYSFTALDITKQLLQQEIREYEYNELMKTYFNEMADGRITDDRDIYCKGILRLDYDEINKFKLIDEGQRSNVIIMLDDKIEKTIQEFCCLIKEQERTFEIRKRIKHLNGIIGRYTVSVYPQKLLKNIPCSFKDVFDIDLDYYVVPNSELERYYNATGFIADSNSAYIY